MAADQKRKRMTGAAVLSGTSWEQDRAKKKNLGTPQNDITFNSHIHLNWDGNGKQVVDRSNQVGISRRHLKPFVNSIPQENRYLADIFSLPQEIFELTNIADVLSYEVWKTHLSESDRNWLMQFLPKDSDTEQVVQTLLDGSNLHFGNPLLKWGASLSSGNLHPDSIICQERCLKSDKKAYYSNLQKYHNDMIDYLVNLKERWETCKESERGNLQKNWGSSNKSEKRVTSHANNSRSHAFDGNSSGTPSESYSLFGNEKASSSDNQNWPVMKGAQVQKRICKKGVSKDGRKNLMIGSDDVLNAGSRSNMGHGLLNRNIKCIDVSNYMSIVKVTKKQLELLKNTKQSGKSILSGCLNRVIGDIGTSQVQSYESFVEEEQKKLHENWLRLVKYDLPAAYADWREKKLQVKQVIDFLDLELKAKVSPFDEEEENLGNCHPEQKGKSTGDLEDMDDSTARLEQDQIFEVCQRSDTCTQQSHPDGVNEEVVRGPHWNRFVDEEDGDEEDGDDDEEEDRGEEEKGEDENEEIIEKPEDGPLQHLCVEAEGVILGSKPNQHGGQSSLLKYGLNSTDTVSNRFLKPDNASPELSVISGNLNTQVFDDKQGVPYSVGEDAWSPVNVQQSYYESAVSHGYASLRLSDVVHPKVNEGPRSLFINSGSSSHDIDSGKDVLQRQPGSASVSYPNQDRNDLLKTSFNGPEMISNNNGQKEAELCLHGQNKVSIAQSHFTGHYQQQAQLPMPLEQHQKRQNEAYLSRHMSENTYSEGLRFLLSRQEHLPSVNLHAVNPSLMPAPLAGGEFFNPNWFSSEHQAWSSFIGSAGSTMSSQSLRNGSMDQSLFSVLSHGNHTQAVPPYHPMPSVQQPTLSTNYGIGSGVPARIGNVLPQTFQSIDYLAEHEAGPSLIVDDRLWTKFPQQNPAVNNNNNTTTTTNGKPLLNPWNH